MNTATSRRRVAALIAVAAVTLGVAGAGQAQAPIVIKFSHVVATDTPKGKAAEFFKPSSPRSAPRARSRSRSMPNSQLYKDKEEMEALQLGAVQMLAPSLAKFGPLGVKEFEVFDLPLHLRRLRGAAQGHRGPVGKQLLEQARRQGHQGPGLLGQRLQGRCRANKPLRTPADFKGLKMRIQSSKVLGRADAGARRACRR